jgi:hypothetical protein
LGLELISILSGGESFGKIVCNGDSF